MKNDTNPPTVHRFEIPTSIVTKVMMPKGAIILDVQAGKSGPNVWAMVDTTASKQARFFAVYPTGYAIPHGWDMIHVKTFTGPGPAIHLFEVPAHIAKKMGITA